MRIVYVGLDLGSSSLQQVGIKPKIVIFNKRGDDVKVAALLLKPPHSPRIKENQR